MTFTYHRTVRFADTDAAGVVYFAQALSICHEAYEASLQAAGIDLKQFFRNPSVAIPITHAGIDFYRPMFCGDLLVVKLLPHLISETEFEIRYQIFISEMADKSAANARTLHVCIHPAQRIRQPLPEAIQQWRCRWQTEEPV